jgi:hypothetical protein
MLDMPNSSFAPTSIPVCAQIWLCEAQLLFLQGAKRKPPWCLCRRGLNWNRRRKKNASLFQSPGAQDQAITPSEFSRGCAVGEGPSQTRGAL